MYYIATALVYVVHHFQGVFTISVSMNSNVVGLEGTNGTALKCFFTLDNVKEINNVGIEAELKNTFSTIASFRPQSKISELAPLGDYLSGRVSLSSVNQSSKDVVIDFHELGRTDEKNYKCKVTYTDTNLTSVIKESKPTNITVIAQNKTTMGTSDSGKDVKVVLIAVGCVSCVVGVLWLCMYRTIKRKRVSPIQHRMTSKTKIASVQSDHTRYSFARSLKTVSENVKEEDEKSDEDYYEPFGENVYDVSGKPRYKPKTNEENFHKLKDVATQQQSRYVSEVVHPG